MNDKKYNPNGIFRFYFWVKDGWYGINVSDELPIAWGSTAFSARKSEAGAWWMPLLEKAYAKMHVNYERLAGGWGSETLRIMTGMPTTSFWHQRFSRADIEPIHRRWAQKNYPMTTACCSSGKSWEGLVNGHASSLLDVKDVLDDSGNVVTTLAKVRNPWANEVYKGPWSDKSGEWTDSAKEQLGYENKNDGAFWMPYDRYLSEFYVTDVALYDTYKYHQQEVSIKKGKYQLLTMTNPVDQRVFITCETHAHRLFPRKRDCNPKHGLFIGLLNK